MAKAVLVVESDARRREEMGTWLEDAGFEVITCPGPQAPDHVCVATTRGDCPLEESCDVVVLDMHLAPDEALHGTPAWELLLFYMERGDYIVALSGYDDPVRPRSDDDVAVLSRPPDRKQLISAVRRFAPAPVDGGDDGNDPAR